MEEDDDHALLQRFRRGDREAFETLVARYQRPIYNAALAILRRAEDASDVTQTVFLRVVEKGEGYDPQYKFFSWLYRIAVNESLDLLRRGRHEAPLDDEFDAADAEGRRPEDVLTRAETSMRIRRGVMGLGVNDRVVISLRHFSECSYDEIAEILDLDAKTVKSRLFEARRRLRLVLGDLGAA
ncbi:MAG: sigma-70 family RNA polymerase sigma factor [Caldimonas sp.]